MHQGEKAFWCRPDARASRVLLQVGRRRFQGVEERRFSQLFGSNSSLGALAGKAEG
jgi:hypothetical protein